MIEREIDLKVLKPTATTEGVLSQIVAKCFRPGGLTVDELNASFAGASGAEFKGMTVASMPQQMMADADEWDRVYAV